MPFYAPPAATITTPHRRRIPIPAQPVGLLIYRVCRGSEVKSTGYANFVI